jgi:hypothetical protein
MYTEAKATFRLASAVSARRLVKISDSTTTDPPEVEHCGAGGDAIGVTEFAESTTTETVGVKLINDGGLFEIEAHAAISRGDKVYPAATGRISSTPAGKAIGVATEAASAQGDHIAVAVQPGITGEKKCVPIPLAILRELSSGDIPVGATATDATGGVLAKDSTPILEAANGDTDGSLRLNWAADNTDAVGFQVPIPDIDPGENLEIHFRAAMAGSTDTPAISADSYFNEGDTKVEDDSATVAGTDYDEYTITVAATDIPSGAQTLSVELTPGAHGTDILYMTALWLEYGKNNLA